MLLDYEGCYWIIRVVIGVIRDVSDVVGMLVVL